MLNGHLFESVVPPAIGQPKLAVYISCLISAALLTLHLLSVAYNRAHARRLLGSMPADPPPPLLISSSQPSRPQQLLGSGGSRPMPPNMSSLETTPTYGSNMETSATATATTTTATSDHYQQQQQQAKFQPAASSCFDLIGNVVDLQAIGAAASSLGVINGGGGASCPTTSSSNQFKRQFQVPIHILVQLLALQLLVILLVESQNYIHDMGSAAANSQHVDPTTAWMPAAAAALASKNPIGPITWLLVLALYYLIGCLTFWLMGQLVKLNLNLASLSLATQPPGCSSWWPNNNNRTGSSTSSSASSSSSSTNKQQQQQQHQLASIFAPSSISSTQSRDSPTDSTDGVKYGGGQTIYGAGQRTMNLYGGGHPSVFYGTTSGLQQQSLANNNSNTNQGYSSSAGNLLGYLLNPSISKPIQLIVCHLCPCIFVTFIVWLSAPRVAWFNSLTYTTSFGLQFAYWPLLVDLIGATTAQSTLLYYIPAVSFLPTRRSI